MVFDEYNDWRKPGYTVWTDTKVFIICVISYNLIEFYLGDKSSKEEDKRAKEKERKKTKEKEKAKEKERDEKAKEKEKRDKEKAKALEEKEKKKKVSFYDTGWLISFGEIPTKTTWMMIYE